jgi:phage protein D
MTTTQINDEQLRLDQALMSPAVSLGTGRTPLSEVADAALERVVVDMHSGLPDVCELVFRDPAWDILDEAGLALGTVVVVEGGVMNEQQAKPLFEGEITAIEGSYGDVDSYSIVRGCTLDHRLQRVRRTRTFLNAKDSDVARQLAGDSGLTVGEITATTQVHPHLAQDNQTDWHFLRERAEELGFEVGVVEGKFYFREGTAATEAAAVTVTSDSNLIRFAPRVSAANLAGEVEARAWDPVNAKAVAAQQPISSVSVDIGAGDAATAAGLFAAKTPPAQAAASELGPLPSTTATVVYDRAVTVDSNSTKALTDAAAALAEQSASGFAEAEGELLGDARVVAGAVLKVEGVPKAFSGSWTVTRARHEFHSRTGYRTRFWVSGRQDRSLLSLTSGIGKNVGPTRIQGVVGAIVTSLDDPLGLARVKVALPWLSPEYETNWAPVVQLTAGKATGAMFLPEPGDQVLVAFEFGDLRRPYVIGSVVNKRTGAGGVLQPGGTEPGKAAIKAGKPSSVAWRGLVTPGGNRLAFHDEGPPGGGKPTASEVVLTTDGDKLGLLLDAVKGELRIVCTPGSPPGKLSIECDGDVEIKAGAAGTLTVDGGQMLTLKGKQVQIEGTGPVAVKGKPIQLN